MPRMSSLIHINPEGVIKNAYFSQAVLAPAGWHTLYVGGQNAVTAEGELVGKGDITAQAHQVLANITTILDEVGADLTNVVKWNVFVKQGEDPMPAFAVFQQAWNRMGKDHDPPAITLCYVASLTLPDWLLEVELVAVVAP